MHLPNPRYRLYSSPTSYASLAWSLLTGARKAGQDVALLESDACATFRTRHALATNQARVGIYLALKAVLRGDRTKVVMSPYTIFEVVNMVICAGGQPVFADIEPTTCNIDAAEVEKLADDKTGAVLVTHLHGLACDVERIAAFCRARGIALIEDAAQAVGTAVNGKPVGTFGEAGIFSYGLMKNVNAFYGGMVLTDSDEVDARMRAISDSYPVVPPANLVSRATYAFTLDIATWPPLFRSVTFWLFRYGYRNKIPLLASISRSENNPRRRNEFPEAYQWRMSDAQARIVRPQLGEIDRKFQQRLAIARLYHAGLSDIPEIVLPPLREDGSHGYQTFAIQVPNRAGLLDHLLDSLRDCAPQHLRNCAELPCFAEFARDCPQARKTADSVILLPTYPRYGTVEAERTLQAVRAYFGK